VDQWGFAKDECLIGQNKGETGRRKKGRRTIGRGRLR